MTISEILTELSIYEEDLKEEKLDIISSMLSVQFLFFCTFYYNKFYQKAKNYINEYYKEILDETEFEHIAYIKIKKYLTSLENTAIINPIILNNIITIFKELDSRTDYRVFAFIKFEKHCLDLINDNILTNLNYLFLNYQENSYENKEYIKSLIPREEKNDANKNK